MRTGDVIWNPLTGEKAMIVEPVEKSDGAGLVVDFAVEAGGFVPGGEHLHDHCAEHFEIHAGRIAFARRGRAYVGSGRAGHRRTRDVAPVVERRRG